MVLALGWHDSDLHPLVTHQSGTTQYVTSFDRFGTAGNPVPQG